MLHPSPSMKHLALACVSLFACADSVDTAEVESAATNPQATNPQATNPQGTSYAGTNYVGTNYSNAMYGGSPLASVTLTGSMLSVKRYISGGYEMRYPDRICTYLTGALFPICQNVNLSTTPSPLAGVTFTSTFYDPATHLVRSAMLRIGSGTSDTNALRRDYTVAGFPLDGTNLVPEGPNCGNPDKCHTNSDLWLYEVYLLDTDGSAHTFCKWDNHAIALGGTWDSTGQRTSTTTSSGQFEFACTFGTIAKCTRWGYRPFGTANNNVGTSVELAPYHQACVRAATADYCANGHSFTKDGTLIDIWDYQWGVNQTGLIPQTASVDLMKYGLHDTAFVFESEFDGSGATKVDHMRYDELVGTSGYGSINDPDPSIGCPNRFDLGTINNDGSQYLIEPTRKASIAPAVAPFVRVSNTGMCSHTEQTVGKYLNANCSACTKSLYDQSLQDPNHAHASCFEANGAWTSDCIAAAATCSSADRMATHSECLAPTRNTAIYQNDSACTITVCSAPGYASCCTTPTTVGTWTSTCVAKANDVCRGGQEHSTLTTQYGFCGTETSPTNAL